MKVKQIKEYVLTIFFCAAGLILLGMMMPFVLAIALHGMIFAVPFLVFEYFIKSRVSEKLPVMDRADAVCERDKEPEKNGQCIAPSAAERDSSLKAQDVTKWYEEQGRKRILWITEELTRKGIYACWIRKDGICNVRTAKGYRRAGSLPGFPGDSIGIVRELLVDEGWNAERQGKYLYLEWKKG